jgi:hypothetical protein
MITDGSCRIAWAMAMRAFMPLENLPMRLFRPLGLLDGLQDLLAPPLDVALAHSPQLPEVR